MGAFFESALLFSLAVLIVLIGLLIYYFKGRITDLEQKNMKCLELIGDVYKSHLELKRGMPTMIGGQTSMPSDPRIKIELQEHPQYDYCNTNFYDDEDDDDEEDDDEDDDDDVDSIIEIVDNIQDNQDNDSQVKMINVDLSGTIELSENMDVEEIEIEDDAAISNDELIKVDESELIVVNKIETEVDEGVETQSNSQNVSRESYKKMSLPALRGFIISNGYQTDNAKLQKMKKNELIDLIIESQQ
jgi:hypothetical protein